MSNWLVSELGGLSEDLMRARGNEKSVATATEKRTIRRRLYKPNFPRMLVNTQPTSAVSEVLISLLIFAFVFFTTYPPP